MNATINETTREALKAAIRKALYAWNDCDWTMDLDPEAMEEYEERVKGDAAEANRLGEEAIALLSAGDFSKAFECIRQASGLEDAYGDDPTWGPVRQAFEDAEDERQIEMTHSING